MIQFSLSVCYKLSLVSDLMLLATDQPLVLLADPEQFPLLHLQPQVVLDQTSQPRVELLPRLLPIVPYWGSRLLLGS